MVLPDGLKPRIAELALCLALGRALEHQSGDPIRLSLLTPAKAGIPFGATDE